ncbi:MAG: tetratricopeptide repeat protein [Lewinella sp.]
MKAFTRIFLILTLLTFAGLMGNILAEPVGEWMEAHFPEKWLWLAFGVLVLSTLVAWVLENRGAEKEQSAPASNGPAAVPPHPIASLPTQDEPRPPTKDEYEAILAKFQEDRLDDTVALMEKIPAYQRKTPLYRQQLSALAEAKATNLTPELSRNQLSIGILSFLQIHKPQEEYTPPVAAANQTSNQAHIITEHHDSRLWISQNFLGRTDKIKEIKGLLDQPEPVDIIVTGGPGNGKTTICHHVLQLWLEEVAGRVVYLVEVEFITTVAGLARALGGLCGLKPEVATVDNVLAALTELPNGVLYLDNLESVLVDGEAHRFLGRLQRSANLALLTSSRRDVADFTSAPLDVLDDNDAVELFQLIWQQQTGQRIAEEEQLKYLQEFATKDLGCHPLTLEITSSHARTVENLPQLVEEFRDSKTTYFTRYASDEAGRVNNLFQSLGLSLNRLRDRPNALRLLALCAVYESGLSGPMQKLLLKENVFTPADRSVLLERNLARYTDGFLSVLPPVVRFLHSLLNDSNKLFEGTQLFQDGRTIATNKSIPVPNRLEFLAFYADDVTPDLPEVVNSFNNLAFLRNNFAARPILERLIDSFSASGADYNQTLGDVLTNLGEIEFIEGNNDQARKLYQNAEALYQKTGDDLGRAHIYHYLASVFVAEENHSEAQKTWEMALALYRSVNAKQDVADTLLYLAEIIVEISGPKTKLKELLSEADQLIKKYNYGGLEDKLAKLKSVLKD